MSRFAGRQRLHKPVGLTGGMGSGKSSVARYCQEQFGIKYIDADLVCRDLLAPGALGWQAFVATFGEDFLDANRNIDRQRLRKAIFRDNEFRQHLNNLIHPLAHQEINNILACSEPERCLVEVPLLYEAGWDDDFSSVIVVYATDKCCLARLMQRDQLDREGAIQAIDAQLPLTEKARRADHLIDNSGTWEETCRQLLQLGKTLWGWGLR